MRPWSLTDAILGANMCSEVQSTGSKMSLSDLWLCLSEAYGHRRSSKELVGMPLSLFKKVYLSSGAIVFWSVLCCLEG